MPFPYTINDVTAAMAGVVRDEAERLTANGATLDRFAVQAIVDRYSNDAPLEIVSDVDGNGTAFVDVPVDPDEKGVFDPAFSIIRSIEFPIEQAPPQFIAAEDYRIYRRPGATKVMLSSSTPSSSDVLRMQWSARHAADGSTVPDKDFYAVCDYASSLALEALAAIYVQAGDPSINADSVNYRTKSQEYLTLAKAIRKRYFDHMGIEEGATGTENAAAMSIGNMSNVQNSGVDRLVHGRGTR